MKKVQFFLLLFLLLFIGCAFESEMPIDESSGTAPVYGVLRLENHYSGPCYYTYNIYIDNAYLGLLTNRESREVALKVGQHIITGTVRKYCPGDEVRQEYIIHDEFYLGEKGLVWNWYE